MRQAARQVTWKRWVFTVLGLVVAFLLIAPLFARLVDGSQLGSTPAFFLIGASALVGVASINLDPDAKKPHLARTRRGLLWAGVLLYFVLPAE